MNPQHPNGRVQTAQPEQMRRANRQVYATPLDTSVNYGTAPENKLFNLARSLSAIEPTIAGALDSWADRKAKEAEAQAMADVMAGKAPDEDQGRSYIRFYNKQKGRVTGMTEIDQALRSAYAEEGLATNDDPAAFKDWLGKKRAELLSPYDEADPDFKAGMMPFVEQSIQNLALHHSGQLARNVQEGQIRLFEDEAAHVVDTLWTRGADSSQIGAALDQHVQRLFPLLGREANDKAIQIVTEAAVSRGDASLLSALDHIKGGSGPLGGTRAAKVARERAEEAILSRQIQQENLDWTRLQREEQLTEREAERQAMEAFISGEFDQDASNRLAVSHPGIWDRLMSRQDSDRRRDAVATPEETSQQWQQFYAEPSFETVDRLIDEGLFQSPADVEQAIRIVNQAQGSDEGAAYVKEIGQVRGLLEKALSDKMTGVFDSEKVTYMELFDQEVARLSESGELQGKSRLEIRKALNGVALEVRKMAAEFSEQGKEMTPEIEEQLLQQGLQGKQQQTDASTGEWQWDRQQRLDARNALDARRGLDARSALVEADPTRWTVEPVVPGVRNREELNAFFSGDPEKVRAVFQQNGITTREQARDFVETQQRLLDREQSQGVERLESAPQASASPRLRHQNTVDGSMGQLLDKIAIGESGGSYTVAYSNRGALEVPELTSMTIDEVLAWQRAHVRAGNASSASGRYQLLRKTLEGLVEKYDIPRTMRFDPATQDALAILLMQDAGLGAFMAGRLPPEKFSARLAGIWAALPKDASGRGVYDGDSLNKASQKWSDTLAVVQGLRRRQPMA